MNTNHKFFLEEVIALKQSNPEKSDEEISAIAANKFLIPSGVTKEERQESLQVQADNFLKTDEAKEMALRLTQGMGLTPDFIKIEHLKRATDQTNNTKSRDNNLKSLGESMGLYKTQETVNETKILNIINVMNFLQNQGVNRDSILTQ